MADHRPRAHRINSTSFVDLGRIVFTTRNPTRLDVVGRPMGGQRQTLILLRGSQTPLVLEDTTDEQHQALLDALDAYRGKR